MIACLTKRSNSTQTRWHTTEKMPLDGISEAGNENEEELGDVRLAQIISANPDVEPEPLCDQIIEQVTAFASSEAPQDDRTC